MEFEYVRVSEKGRYQLIKLKRATGIKNWNTLCRWALCVSLADKSRPRKLDDSPDSSVEMSWQVFGGEYRHLYEAALRQRVREDGLELNDTELKAQLRLHLHRGLAYLASDRDLRSIADLCRRATSEPSGSDASHASV